MPIQDWRQLRNQLNKRQFGTDQQEQEAQQDWLEGWTPDMPNAEEEYSNRWRERYIPKIVGNAAASEYIRDISSAPKPSVADYMTPQEILETGYGQSKYDKYTPFDEWITNPIDYRANAQTASEKFWNGTAKMIPYAATTFLDNTAGLVAGLLNVGADAVNGGEFKPLHSFIDNPFSDWMQQARDWSERVLPNYRTTEEAEGQDRWWEHLNANFWGDTFMKNLGFTIGAAASGVVFSGAAKALMGKTANMAYKAAIAASVDGDAAAEAAFQQILQGAAMNNPQKLNTILSKLGSSYKKMRATSQVIGGVAGAMGEARVEALNAAKEFRDERLAVLDRAYDVQSTLIDKEALGYTEKQDVYDGFGNKIGEQDILTEEGRARQKAAHDRLIVDYNRKKEVIENEAEKLANFTFGLNMPLLTASNIVMFGRMMSGGFRSQSMAKVAGKWGKWAGRGTVAGDILSGLGKAATEGTEEISQKMISESMKDIASNNVSAFYNMKYNQNSIKNVSEWLLSVFDTSRTVLQDPTSWEEFAVGALTGALGIPTRVGLKNWSGGLIGGIQEHKEARKLSSERAQELNKRVAESNFRPLYEWAIRNEGLSNIKEIGLNSKINNKGAAIKDSNGNEVGSKFVWKTAEDASILNDVILFDSVGRLDDLKDYVTSFANLTVEDMQNPDVVKALVGENEEFQRLTDEDKLAWIKDRADNVVKQIDTYRNLYNTIDFISFGTSDPEAIKELVYTHAQLQNFEDRYNSLLDEVLNKLNPTLTAISKETKKDGTPTERAKVAEEILNSEDRMRTLFGGAALDIKNRSEISKAVDDREQKAVLEDLERLGVFNKNKSLKEDIQDLQTLVRARQDFYSKLFDPSGRVSFGQRFEEGKKKESDVVDGIRAEEAAKKHAEEEAQGLDTVEKIHSAFRNSDDIESLVEHIRNKARTEKPAADFIKTYDTYNKFRKHILDTHPEVVNKTTGAFSNVMEIVLQDAFEGAKNEADLVNRLSGDLMNLGAVQDVLQQQISAGTITEDEALPILVKDLYDAATNAIKSEAQNFRENWKGTEGRESIKKEKAEDTSKVDDNSNPEPSSKPEVNPEGKPKAKTDIDTVGETESKPTENETDTQKEKRLNDWIKIPAVDAVLKKYAANANTVDELVQSMLNDAKKDGVRNNLKDLLKFDSIRRQLERYVQPKPDVVAKVVSSSEEMAETVESTPDTTISEQDAYRRDDNGEEKLGYYQQSIPEVSSIFMNEVREQIKKRKGASEKQLPGIDAEIIRQAENLTDFVIYDDKGNPASGALSFSDQYKWLKDNDAFRYISQDLSVDDHVVFAKISGCPKFEGEEPIVVAKIVERDADGNVSKLQPLTMLHRKSKDDKYIGLAALWDAIEKDEQSQEPEGGMYIFGGKKNPITSRVFGKRPGIVRYNRKGGKQRIDKIEDYRSDAPIIVINDNNEPVVLRGKVDISKIYLPNTYDWSRPRTGQLYYLVNNGKDSYTPIFIDRMRITSSMIDNAVSEGMLTKARDIINDINALSLTATPDSIENSNLELRKRLQSLGKYLNLDKYFFEYEVDEQTNEPVLAVHWDEGDVHRRYRMPTSDSFASSFDEIVDAVPRISYRDKWLKDSRSNIDGVIKDGLIVSDAEKMRQVGVNFMFDPFDAETGTFKRILTNEKRTATETVKEADAELGEDTGYDSIERSEYRTVEEKSHETRQESFDDMNEESGDVDDLASMTFAGLPEDIKKALKENGVTEEGWDTDMNEAVKQHLLGCI